MVLTSALSLHYLMLQLKEEGTSPRLKLKRNDSGCIQGRSYECIITEY